MKNLLGLILFLSLFPLYSWAGFFTDDDSKLCTDWYGNREACSRSDARRETVVAGQMNTYYGDETNSFTGSYGEGLLITTVKSKDRVRFLFGGQFMYSAANTYINNTTYGTVMMSGDLLFGLSLKPYNNTFLQPVFELNLLVGMKSIEFASPPTGVEEKNLVPSYGGKFSIGLDIPLSKLYAIRPAIDYQINRVDNVLSDDTLVLDALGFSLGIAFK